MTGRDEIVAGLKRWATGSYPEQTAVTYLAATNEPLTRVWVKRTDYSGPESYWLDWEAFDQYGGGLSGGEYATWALARSLCGKAGELNEHLFRLDPERTEAFAHAIAHCRDNWR